MMDSSRVCLANRISRDLRNVDLTYSFWDTNEYLHLCESGVGSALIRDKDYQSGERGFSPRRFHGDLLGSRFSSE